MLLQSGGESNCIASKAAAAREDSTVLREEKDYDYEGTNQFHAAASVT